VGPVVHTRVTIRFGVSTAMFDLASQAASTGAKWTAFVSVIVGGLSFVFLSQTSSIGEIVTWGLLVMVPSAALIGAVVGATAFFIVGFLVQSLAVQHARWSSAFAIGGAMLITILGLGIFFTQGQGFVPPWPVMLLLLFAGGVSGALVARALKAEPIGE
jgi:hypothetical protein